MDILNSDRLKPPEKELLRAVRSPGQMETCSVETAELASRLGMAALLADCLKSPSAEQSEAKRVEVLQSLKIHGQKNRFVREARERGVDILLLKGARSSLDLYEEPYHRSLGDLDLMIRYEQAEPCFEILERLGYRPQWSSWEEQREIDYHVAWYGHGAVIEIHWELGDDFPASEGIWSRVAILGPNLFGLGLEDRFCFNLAHAAKHRLGLSLAKYQDIARIAEVYESDFKGAKLEAVASVWGQNRAIQAAFLMASALFPGSHFDALAPSLGTTGVSQELIIRFCRLPFLNVEKNTQLVRMATRAKLPGLRVDDHIILRKQKPGSKGIKVGNAERLEHFFRRLSGFWDDLKWATVEPEVRNLVKAQKIIDTWPKEKDA